MVDKFKVLRAYTLLNHLRYYTKDLDDKIYSYSENVSDDWVNFVLFKRKILESELTEVENFFEKNKRKPSVYFSEDLLEDNEALLKSRNYKLVNKDSWMFWQGEVPEIEGRIIEVKTDAEFENWIETFIKSYPKEDPQNPYGEQTEFANGLRQDWKTGKSKLDRYFLAFEGDKSVAVGVLTSYDKLGYISAIGSVPEVRGKGFGKKMSLYCVKKSFEAGNDEHFLATEEGDYPFEFYKRIGFIPKFSAFLFTKG